MRNVHFRMPHITQRLLFTLIWLMLFLIGMNVVQASSGTVVKVDPYASYANVGEAFTTNVTIVDVQNLYGVDVTLYWNASVLQVVNVDLRLGVESHPDGVLHESPSSPYIFVVEDNVTQDQGMYRLAATSMAPAPSFNGTGNIVRITFNVTSPGNCSLHLETKLWDRPPQGQVSLPIAHTTIDGSFNVISEFSHVIILLLFMFVSFFAIVYSKKAFGRPRLRLFDS